MTIDRDALVEKAAKAAYADRRSRAGIRGTLTWESEPQWKRDEFLIPARAFIDVILPEVQAQVPDGGLMSEKPNSEERETEPPIGSIVTDNGKGWPWVRTVGGKWTRDACVTFLTWAEVYAWCQRAVDDPDDDTTDPFIPVVMVPADAANRRVPEGGIRMSECEIRQVEALERIAKALEDANQIAMGHAPKPMLTEAATKRIRAEHAIVTGGKVFGATQFDSQYGPIARGLR